MSQINDLSELTAEGQAGQFTVKPVDGYGQKLMQNVTKENSVEVMCRVAARCIGVPFAEVYGTEDKVGFAPDVVAAILARATEAVKKVEASVPNAEPAGEPTNLSLAG
jgi:hypothetical protein